MLMLDVYTPSVKSTSVKVLMSMLVHSEEPNVRKGYLAQAKWLGAVTQRHKRLIVNRTEP